jgi:hypothetical protein
MTLQYSVSPAADCDLDDQAAFLAAEASLGIAPRFYLGCQTFWGVSGVSDLVQSFFSSRTETG